MSNPTNKLLPDDGKISKWSPKSIIYEGDLVVITVIYLLFLWLRKSDSKKYHGLPNKAKQEGACYVIPLGVTCKPTKHLRAVLH